MNNSFWHIWKFPVLLGILSLGGLISALVGDFLWDGLSWIALSIPLVVIGKYISPIARKKT